MNSITLVGRLVADPELKYVGDDSKAVSTFKLAVSRDYRNKDGVIPTDFIFVELWGVRAQTFCQYASKGSLIGIKGSLRIDNYIKNGENKSFTKVFANNYYFLGHKNSSASKVFDSENLFEDVVEEEAVTEEDLPF